MRTIFCIMLLAISAYFIKATVYDEPIIQVNADLDMFWERAQPAWRDLLYQIKLIQENTNK